VSSRPLRSNATWQNAGPENVVGTKKSRQDSPATEARPTDEQWERPLYRAQSAQLVYEGSLGRMTTHFQIASS